MDGDVQKQTGEETNNHDGDSDGDSSEADSEGVILQNLHVTKSNVGDELRRDSEKGFYGRTVISGDEGRQPI